MFLGPQRGVLFWVVVGTSGGEASLEEAGYWRHAPERWALSLASLLASLSFFALMKCHGLCHMPQSCGILSYSRPKVMNTTYHGSELSQKSFLLKGFFFLNNNVLTGPDTSCSHLSIKQQCHVQTAP